MRRTKIVCTIGPGSSSRAALTRLLRAGMEVSRLNFSHGDHAEHARVIGLLRELTANSDKPLAILQDLSGPKVRLGTFAVPSLMLKRGQEVILTAAEAQPSDSPTSGKGVILPLPISGLLEVLQPGNILLLDDGKLSLRVTEREANGRESGSAGDEANIAAGIAANGSALANGNGRGEGIRLRARCLVGGELKPRKGVTAPDLSFSLPAVTDKDKADLRFGLAHGVDWVAVSYVRRAVDLQPLRDIMAEVGIVVPLIAKIEKWEAVRHLEEIVDAADAVMVARGDLGVEMPFDEVPLAQKRIIRACNRAGKPVITATQMLESMISCPRPTRAEAADVANAVLDGTDAVMLSGETAVGQYPVEAVKTMAKIAVRAESALFQMTDYERRMAEPTEVADVVARAAADIAERVNARLILCATSTGGTARKVAQYRPDVPIVAATPNESVYRQLALTWGVFPLCIAPVQDTDSMMQATIAATQERQLARNGDRVVLAAGAPVNNPGTTNLIKVHTMGQPLDSNI